MDSHVAQLCNGLGAVLLDDISHRDDAHQMAVLCKEQRRLSRSRQTVSRLYHLLRHMHPTADKFQAAAHQSGATQPRRQAVAGQGREVLHLLRLNLLLLRPLQMAFASGCSLFCSSA